jgi:hypothetical protein
MKSIIVVFVVTVLFLVGMTKFTNDTNYNEALRYHELSQYYNYIESSITTWESIQMPNTLARAAYDNWNRDPYIDFLWQTDKKTIYDPCPVGYRVAVSDIFRGFTSNEADVDRGANINHSGAFDKGFNFF